MSVHIGLNLLHLVPKETGGAELYARRLIPALLEARPGLALTLFTAREAIASFRAEDWAGDVRVVGIPVNARSRTRRVLAEQTLLPSAVSAVGVDLLHSLFSTAPGAPRVRQVTTILDLIYKRFPDTHGGVMARGLGLLVSLAARRSDRLITISESTKEDVIGFLGVRAERVDVTPLGPGMLAGVKPVPEPELRDRLGLGGAEIVLSVSAKRPHKNLERLIDAVAHVRGHRPLVLVIPGYPTPFEDDLAARARALGIEERVRLVGWLDDQTLEGLYGAARCLVFPSLAEGFGLPVLEAMLRGTPVACSTAPSLTEIAGDAALYFDPTDTAAIARSVERLLAEEALCLRLAERGRRRARAFTWEATARATLESYERALATEAG